MKQEVNPVMAMNPYTEKLINVEPLFRFHDMYGLNEAEQCIDTAIRELVTTKNKNDLELPIYTPLTIMYELRDMLRSLQECEISLPKKKGASQ